MIILDIAFSLPITDSTLQFLLILLIVLLVPIISNKIKMPSLLGLILAGTIIGTNGLNLMARNDSFLLFGTAGLLFIMFLAGLDTDITEFKKNSKKSTVFGILTFLLPFGLSFLVGYYILGFSIMPSVLIGAMIAPHTPITYTIVTKFGVQKDNAVSVTLGGTLITNIISFIIIILVVGMSTGEVNREFWLTLSVSVVLFAAIIVFIFPIIARWFFKKFQDNVLQFVFVLFMMYLGAFLAEVAGIEKIIGALFAGMTLNRLIPRTSPLMNRINFVANSIFIPFFLISVGMLVDLRAFIKDWDTIIAAISLTIVAIGSKFTAAWLTQKIFKYSSAQRSVINGLSSAQAASTLAVVIVGYDLGLLNDAILNGSLLMILVSCTTSALDTQIGAKKLALEELKNSGEEEDVHENTQNERILISVSNEETVEELVNLSTMVKSQSNTHGLYALNIITNNHYTKADDKSAAKILTAATEVAAATDNSLIQLLRHDVNIVNGITNVIKENKITDLVLGIYNKKGLSTSFIGNLNEGILAKSNVTTLIYKSSQPISTVKRHLVFASRNSEKELGFPYWLLKVWNIARNSGTKLVFYAAPSTLAVIKEVHEKYTVPCEFIEFTDWDDFLILSRDFESNDDLIFVMSRKNGFTYHNYMDKLPEYLNKYFQETNFMLIYPIQLGANDAVTIGKPEDIAHAGSIISNLLKKK